MKFISFCKKFIKNIFILMFLLIFLIVCYAYYSGSCQINKPYPCNNNFCLIKHFDINLPNNIINGINLMINNKILYKRVEISSFIENIYNCALPNKKSATIPSKQIEKYHLDLIKFYQYELRDKLSNLIKLNLYPTDLNYPTTCALLIYENEYDFINWHYDYNYYTDRFFTVLIPITSNITCTKFEYKDINNKIISLNLNNHGIIFEGNYLYHRASKLCKNQFRVILSLQYVTNNHISWLNKLRIKLKDYAYIGTF